MQKQSRSMSQVTDLLSDIVIPFDIRESTPCEIYVDRPLDTSDLCQREIRFHAVQLDGPSQLVTINYGKTDLYRLTVADFYLLVSGIDEVELSFGTYRRKALADSVRSRGRIKEYRGENRPVESWVYELVGSYIYNQQPEASAEPRKSDVEFTDIPAEDNVMGN